MALFSNRQAANNPVASSSTATSDFGGAIAAGTGIHAWGAESLIGPSVFGEDGYYIIIQNTGVVNLEVTLNILHGTGVLLYPGATFEVALSQGATVWINNLAAAPGSAQAVLFN